MPLVDEARISVIAGSGGRGIASFLRTRTNPKGGPTGGNGGDGGSVFAESSRNVKTLLSFRRGPSLRARNGGPGGSRGKHGQNGSGIVVKVPLGTVIRDHESGFLHADLNEEGMRTLLAKGGSGGFGNIHFKSSTNRRPRECTEGFKGEERKFLLELRLLADIGIVGLPNAGKSSLLAAMTRAMPKIANYPFTTLEPNLGVIVGNDSEVVIADIPGLIEGAAAGAGHGNRFLKHISRTRLLWQVVDVSELGRAAQVDKNIALIKRELRQFEDGTLLAKPCWLVYNKIDAAPDDLLGKLFAEGRRAKVAGRVFAVSAVTGEGIKQLKQAALEYEREPT